LVPLLLSLACAATETNTAIARRIGLTGMTIGKRRYRWREHGMERPHHELHPGRQHTGQVDQVAALQARPRSGVSLHLSCCVAPGRWRERRHPSS